MKFTTAIAALGLMALAAPSSAAVFIATYHGNIAGGFDGAGIFGSIDQNLAGKALTAVFVYDTARGYRYTNPGVVDVIQGGTYLSSPSSIVRATLTINEITQKLVGEFLTSHSNFIREDTLADFRSTANVTDIVQGDIDYNDYIGVQVYSSVIPATIPASIETPFALTGRFSGGGRIVRSTGVTMFGLDGAGTVTVAAVAAVPEPAVWLTLITGFGAVGGAMRGARRLPAAVSA